MNIFRERSILTGELWFDEEPRDDPGVDVLHYIERTHPIQDAQLDECRTRILDLTKNQEFLWQNLAKNNKYKIKRADQKDQVRYSFWDKNDIDDELLNSFFEFHDHFTSTQGLKRLVRSRVRSFADAGILDLSRTDSKDGASLVWHANCRIDDRVIFFYGASIKNHGDTAYQSLLGRANRYHHWRDILRFKNSGVLVYSFGGWHMGSTDEHLLNINKFKEEFGGEVVKKFRGLRGVTIKGHLSVKLYKMLNK